MKLKIPIGIPVTLTTVLCFCLCFYFLISMTSMFDAFIDEKYTDIQLMLDQFCDEEENYGLNTPNSLTRAVESIDALPGVFAGLYDENMHTDLQRTPTYEDLPFNPFVYPEFNKLIDVSTRGSLTVEFGNEAHPVRPVRLYFRWINDKLAVIGVSKYSLDTIFEPAIFSWAEAFVIVQAVCCILSALSFFIDKRGRR